MQKEQDVHQPPSTFCRKGYANHFLGFKRAYFGGFSGKREYNQRASYCDLLANHLKPAIRTKRRGLLSKKVLLQYDNARPHVAKATIETINKLGFEVLEHPAHSPDLAPSDYHLFAPLKDALRGCKFSSDESVQKAVHQWLCDQPKTFFSDGIYKLVDRWNKCIEMGGDYVEK